MASLALEYGFDPEAILDWSPSILSTVVAVHEFRVAEAKRKAAQRG